MPLYKFKHFAIIIILSALIGVLAGCATQGAHLTLDSSLQKEIRSFNGVGYIPLSNFSEFYGLDYKWDAFARTAVIRKGSTRAALMAGSDRALVDGAMKKMDGPALTSGGEMLVPVSFARDNFGAVISSPAERETVPEEAPVKRFAINTIVIDPGHGGKDVGAIGRRYRLKEKDCALYTAKKVRDILEESGIRVVMTRDNDTFIPLSKRADIPDIKNADLFVSIHINASRSRSLKGFECYFLSNATDDNARALEALENASLKMSEEADAEHSRKLDKTLWDMTLTENRRESAELAGYICSSVRENIDIQVRGIKSARFYVLKYTHVPSVLVEVGYISNREEEAKIRDKKFLDRVADAVSQGILRYKKEYERTGGFTKT